MASKSFYARIGNHVDLKKSSITISQTIGGIPTKVHLFRCGRCEQLASYYKFGKEDFECKPVVHDQTLVSETQPVA